MTERAWSVTAQRQTNFPSCKSDLRLQVELQYLQEKKGSILCSLAVLSITDPRPLRQWRVRVRRCAFADQLSSAEAGSSRPSTSQSTLAASHSPPSDFPSFSSAPRQLCKSMTPLVRGCSDDAPSASTTYLSASICKFFLTSVDLCESTFSSCSFSCLSIWTSRLENWISSLTWRIISYEITTSSVSGCH